MGTDPFPLSRQALLRHDAHLDRGPTGSETEAEWLDRLEIYDRQVREGFADDTQEWNRRDQALLVPTTWIRELLARIVPEPR